LQAEVLFAEARPVIERARPDLWIVDQVDYAAATLAAHMRAPFSWELLTEKPLVYACFGTTQNRNRHLYAALTQAVEDMDVQVVLSLGGAEPSELPERLPGNILVSPFAPQVELLERARLAITQAGMNSALECRSAGVPMVAVPIAHDQPGISAR
jgi:UDP:flavonoid glycosyltransferase YjiC (YdhE family)